MAATCETKDETEEVKKEIDVDLAELIKTNTYEGNNLGKILFCGNSWTVPRISVPSALGYTNFGLKPSDQGMEWWFYVGNITDIDDIDYTVQSTLVRNCVTNTYINLLSIGTSSKEEKYFIAGGWDSSSSQDNSKFICLEPKDNQYYISLETIGLGTEKSIYMKKQTCEYKLIPNSGNTGMVGAKYQIYDNAIFLDNNQYGINLFVEDKRGTILEFMNGVSAGFNDNDDNDPCSYEFAQPRLEIINDKLMKSTITLNNTTKEIKYGNIWLDRQICNYAATPKGGKSLYVGTWITLCLFDQPQEPGNTIALANIWSKTAIPKTDRLVWQSGDKLGYPPILGEGNVYYPLPKTTKEYYKMKGGGKFLTINDFSINILDPKNKDNSPHWPLIPGLGSTYCTAWTIEFNNIWNIPRTFYLFAFVESCECGPSLWEGAVYIYTDKERKNLCGTGWVEQSGYN